MAKRNSVGGTYVKRQRQALNDKEVVCTNHVKTESELDRLPSGAIRRKRK